MAATGLAALTATSTAQATAASPATPLSWNLAYQTHGGPNQEFVAITAPAKNDAWAAGITSNSTGVPGAATGSMFAHWNGHSWTAASIKSSGGFIAEYAHSSSPSNVWIFGQSRATNAAEALVYNGKAWSLRALPGMIDESKVAVLGPSDMWAGTDASCTLSGQANCTPLIHWNGKAWQTVKVAGRLQAVTTTGGHAWFFTLAARYPGTKNTAATPLLYKVTGSKIAGVKAPSVALTSGIGIVAAPSGQLWMLARLASKGHHAALFHWNGTAWKGSVVPASVCPPNTVGFCAVVLSGTLSYDGVAGFWSGWYEHWTGKQWLSVSDSLNAGRKNGYTNSGVSAAIPGTHSVWGVGAVNRTQDDSVFNGLIAVCGPLP